MSIRNIARWFTEEWAIWRLGTTDDAWDNPIESWSLHDTVMGRFRPLSGDRRMSSDRQTEFATAKFYCPSNTDILVGDELRNLVTGERYDVLFVPDVMSMDNHLEIEIGLKEG